MKAGFSKTDISPEMNIELAGYGYYRKRVHKGIHDPLFARALAIESGGSRGLIISCDLVGLESEFVEYLKNELSEKTGIDANAIMLCCTHTHSGPAAAILRGCGMMDPRYVEWLYKQLAKTALDAVNNMCTVSRSSWGEEKIDTGAFNRTYGVGGPFDPNIRVLSLFRDSADPIAIVNYACHPVANGCNDMVSADYPGYAMRILEEHGIDPLFITGFCGDIDPPTERGYELSAKIGSVIADTALRCMNSSEQLNENLTYGIEQVSLQYDIPSMSQLLELLKHARDRIEIEPTDIAAVFSISWITDAIADKSDPCFKPERDTCLQAIKLNDVVLLAYPGETFTAFGLSMRNKFPNAKMMTVNTANGLVGYIPTADEYDREGYASHSAAYIYDTHPFKRGFGELMTEHAISLVERISNTQKFIQTLTA